VETSPIAIVPPAPALRDWVAGYWFIRDLPGVHAGRPIHTSALPYAVLSVNFGEPNRDEDGLAVPRASLLGLQTRARTWHSGPQTYFVMAMLTLHGLARLFPGLGASANTLLDLGGVLGDHGVRRLADPLSAAWQPEVVTRALDQWLMGRASAVAAPSRLAALCHAHRLLRVGHGVATTAEVVGVDRRQLGRWFEHHFGLGPKGVMDLERVHASLQAVQRGAGDPIAGFADQAHQTRSWRRRLGLTPGAYRRGGATVLARAAVAADADAPTFYL
jgi:AraC-like DNA-binding protein